MKAKFWQIIVCVLIGIILATGGVLGLATGIRHARAVVKLEDVTVNAGTVTYLASLYKMRYLASLSDDGVDARNTEEFWQSEKADGVSFGEDFKLAFKYYLTDLVAYAYMYTVHHGYTVEDKIKVAKRNNDVLSEYTEGSITKFNEAAEPYGFDYNDFQNADALIYKAERARELLPDILGADGYENALNDAIDSVVYKDRYDEVDLLKIPAAENYFIK